MRTRVSVSTDFLARTAYRARKAGLLPDHAADEVRATLEKQKDR